MPTILLLVLLLFLGCWDNEIHTTHWHYTWMPKIWPDEKGNNLLINPIVPLTKALVVMVISFPLDFQKILIQIILSLDIGQMPLLCQWSRLQDFIWTLMSNLWIILTKTIAQKWLILTFSTVIILDNATVLSWKDQELKMTSFW